MQTAADGVLSPNIKQQRPLRWRLRKMGMTTFVMACAAGTAAILFLLMFGAVRTIDTFLNDAWAHFLDPRVMAIAFASMLLTACAAALIGRFISRYIKVAIDDLTGLLEDSAVGNRSTLQMPFIELRRLKVAVRRAVDTLRRENENLHKIAYTDRRTGLPNLTSLEQSIEDLLPKATFDDPAALIILDIDNYLRAAERVGPLLSDALLEAAGNRIQNALRSLEGPAALALEKAVFGTMQADEFGLFLPSAHGREAVSTIARAIRMSFNEPFTVSGHQVSLGISGGIVMAPEDADSVQKLFRHAELALRQVRSDTGAGFRYFSPRLNRVARGRYMLEAELREAIANNEFQTYFQPKIDFRTGEVLGAEALARWIRPNGKVISPNTFIPLAEETGLVTKIGEQVLDSACRSAREWARLGHPTKVAVNVSPLQFQTTDLVEVVLSTLKRTGLAPNRLELEITESMAVSEPEKVSRVMRPLRLLGTKVAIDDFGTGHSNLSILTQMQFDVFKIDRQFVSALEDGSQAPAIVEMILAMAETLQLETVAEGVETERQADFLRRRGCTMAQGFLYSPGLPHDGFVDFLNRWDPKTRRTLARQTG